jgi:arylsulfatase A-like enzyme
MRAFFKVLIICVLCWGCRQSGQNDVEQPNILFIAIDDLRPELGCYGNGQILSPELDKLASEGLVFNRTYCQQPICMASRASLMSGLRPDTLHIYNCKSLEEDAPGVLTLDQHFENNGYRIWAAGKIYHHGIDYDVQFGNDYKKVETEQQGRGYLAKESIEIVEKYDGWYRENRNQPGGGRGPAFESPDVPDNAYHDGKMTDMAIEQLARFKSAEEPFFMAVGYKKPHLPFNAPKKYWDLYDVNEIAMADNMYMPENASNFFTYNFGELRNYAGIPKGQLPLSDTLSRKLKHGYYACVSYIDAQIGRLLDGLKESGLEDNTIVILWGDHGWKLGEHGMWCKHTQFELDNHVPMILKVPGQKSAGSTTEALVEFVDIYPSLCELAGIELPAHLQGYSFVPVIDNPDIKWKEGALSYWPSVGRTDPDKLVMGYTIQTQRYRYTEWIKESSGELLARDLFDHQKDPDENKSIANDPGNESIVTELSALLDRGKGWRKIGKEVFQ